jgi:formylglycine-generating enzyme required for sulfatase activity
MWMDTRAGAAALLFVLVCATTACGGDSGSGATDAETNDTTDVGTDTEPDTGTDAELDAELDADVDPAPDADADADAAPDADADSELDSDADTAPELDADTTLALGEPCTTDLECGEGAWCSTVEDYRRCSPRLFGGLEHELDFVWIPSGTFEQGTPEATNEERPFTATLTRPYFVSRTEVTQAQWVAATGGVNAACYQDAESEVCTRVDENPNGPIETVDWYSALAFANWLSVANGLSACYTLLECEDEAEGWHDGIHDGCTGATFAGLSCSGYRILTESEWERAARGNTDTRSYWGDSAEPATVELYSWFDTNAGPRTQVVAQKLPNAFGLYDMVGNAGEWVWDWVYSNEFFDWHPYPAVEATDYLGPAEGFVIGSRGAGWRDPADEMRVANRNGSDPTGRAPDLTIRLGRTSP